MNCYILPGFLVRFSRFAGLAVSLVLGASGVRGAETWRIVDQGVPRDFVVSANEIEVEEQAAGDTVKARVEKAVPGALVYAGQDGRGVVKLPAEFAGKPLADQRSLLHLTLPRAKISPVLYRQGLPENLRTQRIVSSRVLARIPPGRTGVELAGNFGAVVRPTTLPDYVLLEFADGSAALDGAARLRAAGVSAEPQLRRQHERRFIPSDPFFNQQWHLRNTGQGSGLAGVDANPLRAWDFTRGAGVDIAIIDDSFQTTHPDLAPGSYPVSSGFNFDFNGNDSDPAPGAFDAHGTAVGGVAAARGNNSLGVSGSAPEASLLGLRLISGPVSDSEEAEALFWRPNGLVVETSNNSWGPFDGSGIQGPDILTKNALRDAAVLGRNGRGLVTVFAAGNGLQRNDDSNFDGYANSRFVLAVAASTNEGQQAYYSEPGANILVSAPSNGGTLGIFTTDVVGGAGYNPGPGEPVDPNYTNSFGGTSSAAPLTTGGVALMLSANGNLGWRDVHEILASTAVQIQPGDSDWVFNGGGFKFNHKFGGGMIDLTAAVARSIGWQNLAAEVSQSRTLAASGLPVAIPDNNATGLSRTFDFASATNLRVEHVEVVLDIQHLHRSDLQIEVISPNGTVSVLAATRPRPNPDFTGDDDRDYTDGGDGWTFTSTHHWGENSAGDWTIRLRDQRSDTTGALRAATMRLYGTVAPLQRLTIEQLTYSVLENAPAVTVRVLRLGGTAGVATVDYAISPFSTASADADFTPVSGQVTFADGVDFADITIPLIDDTLPESREQIFVLLHNPTGAALGGTTLATVQIADDEANAVTIVASDRTAGEKLPGELANPGEFLIQRTQASPEALSVSYAISGNALNGTDFVALTGTAVIPAFDTLVAVPVVINNDSVAEGTEVVTASLVSSPSYLVGSPDVATVSIVDNDLPSVQITVNPGSISEAATTPATFSVSRTGGVENALIVNLESAGTARPAINFNPVIPERIEIPAGATSASIQVFPFNNQIFEGTLNLVIQLAESPDYRFGFSTSARVVFLENDPLPDVKRPTVTLASPAKDARIPVGTAVQAAGNATDNLGVTQVLYRLNDNPWQIANGTKPWSVELLAPDLVAGPNTLRVKAVDTSANESPVVTRQFSYVSPQTLHVAVNGSGTVTSGFSPSSSREAGVTYKIAATPAPGFVFNGWTGDLESPGRIFRFAMPDAETQLVANFIATPFATAQPPLAGVYTGLVQGSDFSLETSGLLKVSVTTKGVFSGTLTLGGVKFPLLGEFNGSGRYRGILPVKKGPALTLDLTLDVIPGATERIVGTISSEALSAAVSADRAVFRRGLAPYPGTESGPLLYTFVLPTGSPLQGREPHGHGYGTLKIDADGIATFRGTLADGTVATQTAPMTKARSFPLFLPLYAKVGVMLGQVTIDEMAPEHDLTASLDWFKPRRKRDLAFPEGFNLPDGMMFGSLFLPPAAGQRVLQGFVDAPNNGSLKLDDGKLAAAIDKTITLTAANFITISNPGLDRLAVEVQPSKGTFSGMFRHPVSGRSTVLKGVLLQRQGVGLGAFRGTAFDGSNPQTGRVTLAPE